MVRRNTHLEGISLSLQVDLVKESILPNVVCSKIVSRRAWDMWDPD